MRFDAIGGGALPALPIKLTHSRRRARKIIAAIEGRRCAEEYDQMPAADATTSNMYDERAGQLVHLVWISPDAGRSAADDVGLLAHEAVHVVRSYLAGIGEDEPSEELCAYLVQDVAGYLAAKHFEWKKRAIAREEK